MNSKNKKGLLVKATGGFYYVKTDSGIIECKARGVFRKIGIAPCVGDALEISVPEKGYACIEKIEDRKNSIVRPPLANIDVLAVVASITEPLPNTLIIDKMISAAISSNAEPAVIITKCDLEAPDSLLQAYRKSGIPVFRTGAGETDGVEEIRKYIKGKTAAFIGNSGVGKSTLLNALFPELELVTGEISRKLGRGRHTTRTVVMYPYNDGFVIDTPGFSTMDMEMYRMTSKEDLPYTFPEFEDYLGSCRFTSCSHTCEKGCAVIKAVKDGKISESRYSSYLAMYGEVKNKKPWETV